MILDDMTYSDSILDQAAPAGSSSDQREDSMPDTKAETGAASTGETEEETKPATPLTAPPNRDTAFGQAVWLMLNTPQFKHTFLADLEWMILPPILLGQYRIFYAEGRVVGFAAWAYVSDDVKQRLEGTNPRLTPAEWKSGDNVVLTELFTPFGGQERILEELKKGPFAGRDFKNSVHSASPVRSIH